MIYVFQGDFLSLTRDRVVKSYGAGFQVHSNLTDNGSIPLKTENLLPSVPNAMSAL